MHALMPGPLLVRNSGPLLWSKKSLFHGNPDQPEIPVRAFMYGLIVLTTYTAFFGEGFSSSGFSFRTSTNFPLYVPLFLPFSADRSSKKPCSQSLILSGTTLAGFLPGFQSFQLKIKRLDKMKFFQFCIKTFLWFHIMLFVRFWCWFFLRFSVWTCVW